MGESTGPMNVGSKSRFSTVGGSFLQYDLETEPVNFDYTAHNFGLKTQKTEEKETQWQAFERTVGDLIANAEDGVQYKVLFLGRHGQGFHNLAEKRYGTKAWNEHWSKLDGDGDLYWVDAHLTELGIEQAETAGEYWAKQLETEKIPTPQSYYTSPLHRCCQTAQYTFGNLEVPPGRPFIPTVKELLREANGVHTCDRRSSKSHIQKYFPSYRIEAGFTEEDELWDANVRESDSKLDDRLKTLFDDIFDTDPNTWLSLSAHSGAIASILRVIGHRPFPLPTGAVIPVLVKRTIRS
ncbi:hypothetical protein MMC25_002326 [Agyrium rufum]|nr:hypothetical protein [Agyrium rufum]